MLTATPADVTAAFINTNIPFSCTRVFNKAAFRALGTDFLTQQHSSFLLPRAKQDHFPLLPNQHFRELPLSKTFPPSYVF